MSEQLPQSSRLPDHPTVDVRVVLFTVAQGELLVAVNETYRGFQIPRNFPIEGESLDAAARRNVLDSTTLQEQYLEQLYTFNITEPGRRWVIIVSYVALICSSERPHETDALRWMPADRLTNTSDADRTVLDYAIVRLRAKLGYTNIAFHLLPETFTLTELQLAYETILGQPLDKRNFRRRMIASGILKATNDKRRDGSHRPAALYRFHAEHDTTAYLTPPWSDPAEGAGHS
jgi:8-oxo-dGTP diphosphatase